MEDNSEPSESDIMTGSVSRDDEFIDDTELKSDDVHLENHCSETITQSSSARTTEKIVTAEENYSLNGRSKVVLYILSIGLFHDDGSP